jgi:hypothetical protein
VPKYVGKTPGPERYGWASFGGRINPGRNYLLFGKIAGVRVEGVAAIPPRGFPHDAGYYSKCDNLLYICDDEDEKRSDEYCTREQAEKLGYHYFDESKRQCFNPDHHSHTWLTFEEWVSATKCGDEQGDNGEQYAAMSGAMETLEALGFNTRVVIWFDN